MKLLVGLGNPGKKYENTRHNVGFCVLDAFSEKTGLVFDEEKFKGLYGKIRIGNETMICLKPQTYMNLSGEAVRAISDYYNIAAEDILIVYDDIDLPLGKLRLRKNGTGGNHNGIKSVVQMMGTKNIKRIRIGVDKNPLYDQKDYVLSKFPAEQQEIMQHAFERAADALIDFADHDFDYLMNHYNKDEENETVRAD